MPSHLALRALRRAVNPGRRTFKNTTRIARVEKVYDGDTINVLTRLTRREKYWEYPVRIVGIDAPEITLPRDAPHRELHMHAARVVRDRLAQLIPVGSNVLIKFQKEEKYGRLLGEVFTLEPCCGIGCCRWYPKTNVAEELLQEGMVVRYDGKGKPGFSKRHLERIVNSEMQASTRV
jgi:endonuclease YncB( thermonuclease family)